MITFQGAIVKYWQVQPDTMLAFPFPVSSSSTLNIYLGPLEPCAGKDPLQVKWIYFHATFKVPMATWIRHGFEPSVTGASHDFAVSLAKHLAPAHTIPHASESHLRRCPEDEHHALVLPQTEARHLAGCPEVCTFGGLGKNGHRHPQPCPPSDWGKVQITLFHSGSWKRSLVWSTSSREWVRVSNCKKRTSPRSTMKIPIKVSSPEKQAMLGGNPTQKGPKCFFIKYLKKIYHRTVC